MWSWEQSNELGGSQLEGVATGMGPMLIPMGAPEHIGIPPITNIPGIAPELLVSIFALTGTPDICMAPCMPEMPTTPAPASGIIGISLPHATPAPLLPGTAADAVAGKVAKPLPDGMLAIDIAAIPGCIATIPCGMPKDTGICIAIPGICI